MRIFQQITLNDNHIHAVECLTGLTEFVLMVPISTHVTVKLKLPYKYLKNSHSNE